jgi:tRNA(adenine34) deaminase
MHKETKDEHYMRQALKEAHMAVEMGEVPVGAVIVADDIVIARAHNMTERLNDVTAHAEMQAITSAANYLGGKYLDQCTLYVTVEPCVMCAGASQWAHLGKIVFGARDEKKGFLNMSKQILHPKTKLVSGVLQEECGELMIEFFRKKRK